MREAVGMLEVFGFACAMVAADAGCKAGNVYIEAIDKNKPANADSLPVPLLVCVKFRGSVADVEAAMEAAEKAALAMTGIYSKHIIPGPEEETEGMLQISCIGKAVPKGQAPTKDRF